MSPLLKKKKSQPTADHTTIDHPRFKKKKSAGTYQKRYLTSKEKEKP